MPEYPPGNTNKSKEDPAGKKKVERITSDEVVIQRKSVGRKFKDMIIEADFRSVLHYIGYEILIPMMKNAIVDTVEQGIKRTVYGDRRASMYSRDPRMGQSRITTYNQPVLSRPYPGRNDPRPPAALAIGSGRASNVSARGYVITSREEAEQVLEMMLAIIDQYDWVTVADLHEMLGLESEYVDQGWGWNDIRSAQIRQIREGWVLELPDSLPIAR